jgi:hypothetical protein
MWSFISLGMWAYSEGADLNGLLSVIGATAEERSYAWSGWRKEQDHALWREES